MTPQTAVEEHITTHRLIHGDARSLASIPDQSVHLVVTSPPYWTLKRYHETYGQMGHIADYELFLKELSKVWAEVYRVLVPGGRLVCVVGDVCLSRKEHGRHLVMPLQADIAVSCRKIGFDNLNPIIWHKISNATFEANNGTKFLGKPYEPNAIVKNDIEFLLMQRKPGGYRKPTEEQRKRSMIAKDDFNEWFRQFWDITGASTKNHPAPFPYELAYRLVRMFSFWGDTVLDPFCGTGTTMLAALKCGRNSIGIEIVEDYCRMAFKRLNSENQNLFRKDVITYDNADGNGDQLVVKEKGVAYNPCKKPAKRKKTGKK
jgi:site-specific DNA-methyltransferase (adenine-specific)